MIRPLFVAAALAAAALPAGAAPADWITYTNSAWGYVLAVPPGHVNRPQTTDESGAVFGGDVSQIIVWAEKMTEADLEAQGDALLAEFFNDRWAMTFQQFTPQGVTIDLRKGGTIMHLRLVPVCEGKAFAQYRFGYTPTDAAKFKTVQDQMDVEFKASGACSAI